MNSEASENTFIISPKRSSEKVRALDVNQLGLLSEFPIDTNQSGELVSELRDDDEIYLTVLSLLNDGYAGVILVGPPGTSKSWYASQVAVKLADHNSDRVRFIQFHPSYQYEDFVEGYVPNPEAGGFELKDKHLLEMCQIAREYNNDLCILVIDELSRSDPGRVFGEALTYIEMTKRDQFFRLSSGRISSIPQNLVFLATMNAFDRGVDDIDIALERRFARIAMDPSTQLLEQFLTANGMELTLRNRVLTFFQQLLRNNNTYCKVGHAYFYNVVDEAGLQRLWDHQLRFHMERAFRLDTDGLNQVIRAWERIFQQNADNSNP